MRRFLIGIVCLVFTLTLQAQDGQKQAEKKTVEPSKSLKVGDTPAALKVTKWIKGAEIPAFEKGKIYVVEFWATWCGPCIVMMPHLSALQKEFAEKGVSFIGFSAMDERNTLDKVSAFMSKKGAKLQYSIAFAGDRETYDGWMKASGEDGIPCTFVVDKAGKIAYIGHPMFLDLILPKVVAGTWDPKADGQTMKDILKEFQQVYDAATGKDAAAGLKAIADFEMKYPLLTKIPYLVGPKMNALLMTDKKDAAKEYAIQLIDAAVKNEDHAQLTRMASTLIGANAKNDRGLARVAMVAANKAVAILGDKDLEGQVALARAAYVAGEKVVAKKVAQNAVELAPAETKEATKRVLKAVLEDASAN